MRMPGRRPPLRRMISNGRELELYRSILFPELRGDPGQKVSRCTYFKCKPGRERELEYSQLHTPKRVSSFLNAPSTRLHSRSVRSAYIWV